MILIKKNNEPSAMEVIVIAEDTDDELFLSWLDHHNLVFGMYKVYFVALDQEARMKEGKWLKKNFPTALGMARINATENFMGKKANETLL